jgi:ribosomal protein S18 acetylase RimI-like enzyme
MPAYYIRRLTVDDEPFLWEMLYHALYVPAGQEPFPKEIVREPELARYVLGWGKKDDRGFAAVDEVSLQPIGAVWMRLFSAEYKGYGYVGDDIPELSMALHPAYRDQGIGTDLLRHLIEDARQKYPALSLSVSSDNPAVRLYQRLGFEVIEQNGASFTLKKTLDHHLEG